MMEQREAVPWERDVELQHLTKTDPDPRVRRRAQVLLLVAEGHSQASVARLLHTSAYRVHAWLARFAREGRTGLVDRPLGGLAGLVERGLDAVVDELEGGPAGPLPGVTLLMRHDEDRGVERPAPPPATPARPDRTLTRPRTIQAGLPGWFGAALL
jgi:hypothetical protein